jgi:hypothetical protein
VASRVPNADLRAAQRYGRLVDPIAARYTNPLTGKPLSGEALLLKLAKGESGFNANADSGKAHGTTQFTPGSRSTVLSKFGVDPWRSKDEAYHAAALHLNGSKGLEGYNPGSSSYPSYILGQRVGNVGGSVGGSSGSGGGSPVGAGGGGSPASAGPSFDPGAASTSATDLLSSMLGSRQQAAPPVSAPAAPSFSAQAVLPQGYQAPSGGGPAQASPDVSALLDAVRTQGQDVQRAQAGSTPATSSAGGGGSSGGLSGGSGRVTVAAGANRSGVGLTPGIQKVLRSVASVAGPITVGTGTNHDRLTVDGNVSDHYDGNAADLPTTPGARNIELGRKALIAAGMPRAQAEKATGGIYNLPYGRNRRIQVIFNTNEGGNHHNHVHVGVTGLRRR